MKKNTWMVLLALMMGFGTIAQEDMPEPNDEGKTERLATELGLSEEQQQQLEAVHARFKPEHQKIRQQEKELREKRKQLREQEDMEMKKILTPDQLAKFEKMKAEKKEQRKEGAQRGKKK
ncbi:MAG: hypothetical protein RL226_745 [Bacteroidota bacterium]